MAKSIYEILEDLTTTTSVPGHGKEITHTLPRELFPTALEFENAEDLLQWAEANNITHAVLQKGIQKFLIEVRATFKASKKDQEWSHELGQANVDKMQWTITKRPNQSSKADKAKIELETGIKMAQSMKDADMNDDTILTALTPVYGEEIAQSILSAIA